MFRSNPTEVVFWNCTPTNGILLPHEFVCYRRRDDLDNVNENTARQEDEDGEEAGDNVLRDNESTSDHQDEGTEEHDG